MDPNQQELEQGFKERFALLPKPVQNAITSTDVEKRLRVLADTYKLHLDQWELLENEVKLALYGFQPVEDLGGNIEKEIGVSQELARSLAEDVSRIIFEPIRQQLERQLEHPEAKSEEKSGVEAAREQVLAGNQQETPPVVPATPPQSPPATKVERGPASGTYKPGETSTERKNIHDDPYREPPA